MDARRRPRRLRTGEAYSQTTSRFSATYSARLLAQFSLPLQLQRPTSVKRLPSRQGTQKGYSGISLRKVIRWVPVKAPMLMSY
jgi:hypothetical protein